ncbi:MAG: hypothetical protein DMF92_02265 [Acidobacteria bacterium]|nr:MAG: hypothetical protein DMF92_02265 [Acidobacteriota bacterium]
MAHRLAPQAENDPDEIGSYAFLESVDVADRVVDLSTREAIVTRTKPTAGCDPLSASTNRCVACGTHSRTSLAWNRPREPRPRCRGESRRVLAG